MRTKVLTGLLLLAAALPQPAIAADPVAGRWKVQTKLVAAMDPTNPNYRVGDVRREKWKIGVRRGTATLTTPAGVITGTKVGKAWVFDSTSDTGLGVLFNTHIVARARSAELLKGTIEVRYYSSQFGYQIGLDAWSFTGFR